MLAIIQKLDPPGVGARDLRECLLIQLRESPETDSLTYRLVAEAFPDLIAHRWNDLAKRFGVKPGAVQSAADQLARFNPKPGLKHSDRSDGYIIPDLIVEKIGDRYQVFLNDTGMPRLRLSRAYQEVARDKKKLTQENREFIASKMNSANWMIQAIEQRRQTMLKVMNFIVDRQRDYFEKGIEFLKPLTLREVAEVINMHESTVSRVTNEKYVQTPRGVLPLKFFFSSALATASGEDASARSIRAKLQKMVGEENPSSRSPTSRSSTSSRNRGSRSLAGRSPSTATSWAFCRRECGSAYDPARRRDPGVSVLVPAKDEAANLPEFLRLCADALGPAGFSFEVVVVNDGSRDESPRVLRDLARTYLSAGRHPPCASGASPTPCAPPATWPGGDIFVFYPADLQYLPEDIPALVAPILEGRADIVTGTKQGKYEKAFVSSVYNRLCRALFGVRVTDLNSVKAYRREVMADVPMRPDWHRFMVVVAAADGFRLTSHPVPLHPRKAGVSKFTWKRIPVGVLDLLSVWFQLRFGRKPMLFFGVIGAALFACGLLAGVAALVLRFGFGIGFRPFLNLVETMVISGIALFGFGFVGELIAGLREENREIARALGRLGAADHRD